MHFSTGFLGLRDLLFFLGELKVPCLLKEPLFLGDDFPGDPETLESLRLGSESIESELELELSMLMVLRRADCVSLATWRLTDSPCIRAPTTDWRWR